MSSFRKIRQRRSENIVLVKCDSTYKYDEFSKSVTPQNKPRTRKQHKDIFHLIWFAASCLLPQAHAQSNSDAIDLPKGYVLLLQAQGEGAQVYGCVNEKWMLKAPDAKLLDTHGHVIGKHYAGPSWQMKDGSLVTGKAVAKKASSDADSVPWLLHEATSGTGKFTAVRFIQRRDTHGGMAPSTRFSHREELRVPYTSTYLFYLAHL